VRVFVGQFMTCRKVPDRLTDLIVEHVVDLKRLAPFGAIVSVSQRVEDLSYDTLVGMFGLPQEKFQRILSPDPAHDLHDAQHGDVALRVLVESGFQGGEDRLPGLLQGGRRMMAKGRVTQHLDQDGPRFGAPDFARGTKGGVLDFRIGVAKQLKKKEYRFITVRGAECSVRYETVITVA